MNPTVCKSGQSQNKQKRCLCDAAKGNNGDGCKHRRKRFTTKRVSLHRTQNRRERVAFSRPGMGNVGRVYNQPMGGVTSPHMARASKATGPLAKQHQENVGLNHRSIIAMDSHFAIEGVSKSCYCFPIDPKTQRVCIVRCPNANASIATSTQWSTRSYCSRAGDLNIYFRASKRGVAARETSWPLRVGPRGCVMRLKDRG